MRFGQNAVRTPGRTHDNDCVTKGVRKAVTPLARLREAILRFGQNAVKTPGRTHDNDCVTKGVKFRSSLFKGWA